MAATVEGTFRIVDRASGPMRRMEAQARKTDKALEGLGRRLERTGAQKTEVLARKQGVLGNELSATTRKVNEHERSVRRMGRSHDDAANRSRKAENALTKLGGALGKVGSLVPTVLAGTSAMGSAFIAAGQAITYAAGAVVAILPRLASLGSLMGAIPGAIAAAVTGFGAMAAGLSGVMGAVSAGLTKQRDASRSAMEMADKHRQSMRALRDAQLGVTRAEEGVRDAQLNARNAQRALTEARRDARRELVDMQLAAQGSLLGERAAAIALQRARRNLANADFSGPDADLERREAALGVQQAQLGLRQARVERGRALQDARRARRRGVEGSDQVRGARQGVVEASRGIRDALHSQTTAAEQLADAQRENNRLMRQGSAANIAYTAAMKNLSPEAQRLVRQVVSMRDAFIDFRKEAGRDLLPHLTRSLKYVGTLLPMIATQFRRAGGVIGREIERIMKGLATTRRADLRSILGSSVRIVDRFARSFGAVAEAVIDLTVAAEPFTEWIADVILKWARWSQEAASVGRRTGRLAAYFANAKTQLQQLGRILHYAWDILVGIGRAATPLGDWLWDAFERGAKAADHWVNSFRGQQSLKAYFESLKEPITAVAQAVGAIARVWGKLAVNGQMNKGFVEAMNTFRDGAPYLEDAIIGMQTVFPAVARIIVQLARLIGNLPFSPIVILLNTISRILEILNQLIERFPILGTIISTVLAGSVMSKAISMAGKLFGKWDSLFTLFRRNRGTQAPVPTKPVATPAGPGTAPTGGAPAGRGGRFGRLGRFARGAAGPAALAGVVGGTIAGDAIGGTTGSVVSTAAMGAGMGAMLGPWGALAGGLGGAALGFFAGRGQEKQQRQTAGEAAAQTALQDPTRAQTRLTDIRKQLDRKRTITLQTGMNASGIEKRQVDAITGGTRDKLEAEAKAIEQGLPELRKQYDAWRAERRRVVQMERANQVGQDIQRIFGVYKRAGQTTLQATRSTVDQLLGEMHKLRGNAKKSLAQQSLDWINSQRRTGKITAAQAREARQDILREMRRTRGSAAEIAGQIYTGQTGIWNGIAKAMTDPVEKAREKVSQEFTKIQNQAVRALQGMGFKKGQAKNIVQEIESHGKAAGSRLRGAYAQGNQYADPKYARGGRIPGSGLLDKVPVAPGQLAAPGELIVNRHTEDRVKRRYGVDLGSEVAGETQAHSAPNYERMRRHPMPPGMARGGMVRVPGDPNTTGGRDTVAASIANEVGRWISRYHGQVGYAYDPGGGHKSPGHNVTGTATDVVPLAGDWDLLEKGLRVLVGEGKTVYYGTNGVGTPLANHGRGNHAHIEWATGGKFTGRGGPGGAGGIGGPAPRLKIPGTGVGGMAGAVGDAALALYGGALQRKLNAVVGGGGGAMPTGGGGNAEANRRLGRKIMLAFGFGADQWGPLNSLWTKESGWSTTADNPSSDAYGIPQSLPGSKMASAGADWRTNPATQIKWGLQYIKGRYGNPAAAWAHSQATNWYGDGGDFMVRRPTTIGVGDKGPERVQVTPAGKAKAGGGGPITVHIGHIVNKEEGDIRRILHRELEGLVEDLELVGED